MLVMMTLPVAVTVLGADKDTGINVTSAFWELKPFSAL
jgi:hypothetical protein